jgi:hypothetical protein
MALALLLYYVWVGAQRRAHPIRQRVPQTDRQTGHLLPLHRATLDRRAAAPASRGLQGAAVVRQGRDAGAGAVGLADRAEQKTSGSS